MEMLERQNMELVQRLRKEQDRLEEQENNFKKQLEDVNSEHTNNLKKMGFLLANQKKVNNVILINPKVMGEGQNCPLTENHAVDPLMIQIER